MISVPFSGMACMCIYYRWFHPTGPLYFFEPGLAKFVARWVPCTAVKKTSSLTHVAPLPPKMEFAQIKVCYVNIHVGSSLL